jgi:hypothetical protein
MPARVTVSEIPGVIMMKNELERKIRERTGEDVYLEYTGVQKGKLTWRARTKPQVIEITVPPIIPSINP